MIDVLRRRHGLGLAALAVLMVATAACAPSPGPDPDPGPQYAFVFERTDAPMAPANVPMGQGVTSAPITAPMETAASGTVTVPCSDSYATNVAGYFSVINSFDDQGRPSGFVKAIDGVCGVPIPVSYDTLSYEVGSYFVVTAGVDDGSGTLPWAHPEGTPLTFSFRGDLINTQQTL